MGWFSLSGFAAAFASFAKGFDAFLDDMQNDLLDALGLDTDNQFADAFAQVAAGIIAADGKIGRDEKKAFRDLLNQCTPLADHKEAILEAFEDAVDAHSESKLTAESEMLAAVRRIDKDSSKHTLATLAMKLVTADGDIDPAEVALLNKIVNALGLNPSDYQPSL